MLESVRLCTFGTHGYQQVQVDCHFLGAVVTEYMDNTQLKAILMDVMNSVKERCVKPVALPQNIVDTICAERIKENSPSES